MIMLAEDKNDDFTRSLKSAFNDKNQFHLKHKQLPPPAASW